MVRDGGLFARADAGYWLDTGTPAAFLEASFDYVNGKRGSITTPTLTERPDGSLAEGDAQIDGQLIGRCVLFAGCHVDASARVERSILGPGTVIAAGAIVSDSVLMAGCQVAADAKVAGSIMGPRAIVGQRCDVRSVSVLGADAVVSSGTLVDGERVSA
jgi:NDP-sugar pyrophosphorylase family protein